MRAATSYWAPFQIHPERRATRAGSSELRGTVCIQTLMSVPGLERVWSVSVLPIMIMDGGLDICSGLDWSSSSILANS
jgi:hypothetical protein